MAIDASKIKQRISVEISDIQIASVLQAIVDVSGGGGGETLTIGKATPTADGLMSKEDKSKLDGAIFVPSGGTNGQFLKKTASGYEWGADNDTVYTLPAAGTSIGGVKQAATVAALANDAAAAAIVTAFNTLLANLKAAGVVASK